MRSSLLARRVASVAAAATIATTGVMAVAGAASASTTHRRMPTHLSIADRRAVAHHKHVTVIAGRLTSFRSPLHGKLIFLDRLSGGHRLVVVGREHTGRGGVVVFVVDPKMTTHYALVFPGTPHFHSSHSRVVTVRG
jgi:hypothetical protein